MTTFYFDAGLFTAILFALLFSGSPVIMLFALILAWYVSDDISEISKERRTNNDSPGITDDEDDERGTGT